MPRLFVDREVKEALQVRSFSPAQLIADMAKAFKVSQESMRYRLENLGVLDPGGLVSCAPSQCNPPVGG